ncbi:NAD-dependent epimerase/dehydratase family protein [Acinetobacter sp. ANC 4633]|uniref:NAD-dependent epimerase/dehydratase family protein n=1 Tax=Acinetobacter sp. ANC 4633 TaxID=2529845 RepID=UPI00103AC8BE|nr:NAD-dependent epimerase/dehydratase family protein [Acinetobacter sp. ANC 4633]TCB25909.1 NAD-dependent epimerase/dehydratase family protein [Acinetobacter sp. ANC 4633]
MHIVFIGYGKTSQRVAKQLFAQGHQISTISRSPKTDPFAQHYVQDVHRLDLSTFAPIDWVYVLLSPEQSSVEGYQHTYVDSVAPIVAALRSHSVKKVVVVSSTRVYGEDAGQVIDDDSLIQPSDAQGSLLREMELRWQQAYPEQSVVIRPSGIYGDSVARMCKLAQNTTVYPNTHWSNRIHADDLAGFLTYLTQLQQHQPSYIVSNHQPLPLHEVLVWFQQQLELPRLSVQYPEQVSGKRLYATRLQQSGFQLQHTDCFQDYAALLAQQPR